MRGRFISRAAKDHVDHFFFAVLPDPEAAARIARFAAALRMGLGLRGKLILAERLHVTLCRVPVSLPPSVMTALKEAAEHAEMPPFTVKFDHVMSYSGETGKRALVLCEGDGDGTAGLHELHRAVGKVMVSAGLHHITLSKRFNPHVTLLYGDHDLPKQPVEPISWYVDKLTLIHSLQGRGIYRVLGEWPLRGKIPAMPRIGSWQPSTVPAHLPSSRLAKMTRGSSS